MRCGIAASLASFLVVSLAIAPLPALGDHVDTSEIITVLRPDAIPAITDPSFGTDGASWLNDDSAMIGLVINGDARAYPIAILNWHEIVDDIVGGVPVAVTFCPLCGTGIVYERTVGPDVLVFKVSGKLYKNDLVMYDTLANSLWSQLIGEGLTGEYHGTKLVLRSSATLAWGDWRAAHPDTRLLDRPRDSDGNFLRNYDENPYGGYDASRQVWFPQGNVDPYGVLHPKELVLGVFLNDEARAYPRSVLANEPVVNDVVGGVPILVTYAKDVMKAWERGGRTFSLLGDRIVVDDLGAMYDVLEGRGGSGNLVEVPAVTAFWFAWYDFYPRTSIYGRLDLEPREPLRPGSVSPYLWAVPAALGGVILYLGWRRHRRRL